MDENMNQSQSSSPAPTPTSNNAGGPGMSSQDSAFWKFQGNQFILLIILGAISRIVWALIWSVAGWVLSVVTVVLFVMLIINIVEKKMKPLPIIGNIYNFIK